MTVVSTPANSVVISTPENNGGDTYIRKYLHSQTVTVIFLSASSCNIYPYKQWWKYIHSQTLVELNSRRRLPTSHPSGGAAQYSTGQGRNSVPSLVSQLVFLSVIISISWDISACTEKQNSRYLCRVKQNSRYLCTVKQNSRYLCTVKQNSRCLFWAVKQNSRCLCLYSETELAVSLCSEKELAVSLYSETELTVSLYSEMELAISMFSEAELTCARCKESLTISLQRFLAICV